MPPVRPSAPSHALKGLCILLSSFVAVSLAALSPVAANAATAAAATTTSITASSTRVASGASVMLTITVKRTADGANGAGSVKLYRQTGSSTPWQYVRTVPASSGVAKAGYRATTTYRWHASFVATSANAASSSTTNPTVVVVSATLGSRAVTEASHHAGAPYQWGAAGPTRFDCSGFTRYVFGRLGKSLPHNSSQQYGSVHHISKSSMRVGDLIFIHDGGGIYHVGIYAGSGYMWHSPHSGDHVRKGKIWTSSYYVGRVG
ncbi:MAG: hypothetical protein QOJ92_956 [Frankiales bacterium]|nr:hypothetical protein [Frankiales bacterium]